MQSTTRMCFSFFIQLSLPAIFLFLGLTQAAGGEPPQGPRYPSDLALGPGQKYLFTANSGSSSISMVRISSGEVLHELHLGSAGRLSQITAFLHNGAQRVATSDRDAGKVYILSITDSAPPRLELLRTLSAPGGPEGLQYVQASRTLLVACSKANRVLLFNPDAEKPRASIETVEGPRRLLSLEESSPGQVAVTGRDSVGLLDLGKKIQLGEIAPAKGRALNIQGLAFSRGNILLSHQVQPTEVAVDPQMIVWGLILANRVTSIPVSTIPARDDKRKNDGGAPEEKYIYGVGYQGGDPRHRIVPLDQRQRANGDPGKPALVPRPQASGDLLLLPSGGTNRLVFVDTDEAYLPGTEPLSRQEALPSIKVGDRPVAVACAADGRRAYVINEIGNTFTAFAYDESKGTLEEIHSVSTLPEGYSETTHTADLHVSPSGRFLYGSNRGHDSLAMFSVDQGTGLLTPIGIEPTRGANPRNFSIDPTGTFLLAANQSTDNVTTFRINHDTGALTEVSIAEVPTAVCLKFVEI